MIHEGKLLPSFLGGKARWVRHLTQFEGKQFIEPFAGSAAISFALAGPRPIWNDVDPVLVHILRHFDEQIVPDIVSLEGYYLARRQKDWWKYAFFLQRFAFAGIFRHSSAGFNVPPDKRLEPMNLRPEYERALARWKELQPIVTCQDWTALQAEDYADRICIIDPPFKNSHAPYCYVSDYRLLWDAVRKLQDVAETVVCFEYLDVLERLFPGHDFVTRVSRPNGKRPVRTEAMVILRRGEPDPEVQVH